MKIFSIFFLFFCHTAFASIDLRSLSHHKNLVTSLKKIEFKDFPDAHNPSLIQIEKGFLLTFRYIPDPHHRPWTSQIGIVELDFSLNPISKPILLNTREENSLVPSQAEDARIFTYRNRLFLLYNDNMTVVAPSHSDRRDMFIAELFKIDDAYQLSAPQKLRYIHEYSYRMWQKNWTPFTYQNELLFSYSLNPQLIIYPNLMTGTCYPYYETHTVVHWPYGILRGSSPALLVDGEYLSFFHSGILTGTEASFGFEIWHYFFGAYSFSAKPPFEITHMTLEPIVTEGLYTPSYRSKRVIFPGGFAVIGETIYLAYGKDDCEIWIMTLDKQELKKWMKALKS
jgi:predicted GH43/DUF377 family glycosyl hydrolase